MTYIYIYYVYVRSHFGSRLYFVAKDESAPFATRMASHGDSSVLGSALSTRAGSSAGSSAGVPLPEITRGIAPVFPSTDVALSCPIIWQTNYERNGVGYWVDFPRHVCMALEWAYNQQCDAPFPWHWCWNPQDEPHMQFFDHYIIEPTAMVQRDAMTGTSRPMRRVTIVPGRDDDGVSSGATTPEPVERRDLRASYWQAPTGTVGSQGPDTFVLNERTPARPVRGATVQCKICFHVMLGMELAAHEAQTHDRSNFECHRCGWRFTTSRAVRQHSQARGHAISTQFRYITD